MPTDDAARLEYLRRAYQSARDWYSVAETKAQLLLTINGIFITVLFGSILGKSEDVRKTLEVFGPETWIFLVLASSTVVAAVCCAAMAMWSLHGALSVSELEGLGDLLQIDDGGRQFYIPEAVWYFGHIARLEPDIVKATLLDSNTLRFEVRVLSHHVTTIAPRVLRKHRFVNAGWALTAAALVMIALAVSSIAIRL